MSKRFLTNAALVAVAIAMLIGIQMLSGSVNHVQAQSASDTPTPTPTPTPSATPTPTPTPTPGGETVCSPGFWKNHTELWFGPDYCGLTSAQTLCNLKPQCNNNNAARQAAALCLENTVGHLCSD